MRKCRLCGSLIRRRAEFCRFCTAPQGASRDTVPNGVPQSSTQGSAPHWMPVGNPTDAPMIGSGERPPHGSPLEPEWAPEAIEPRETMVVDEREAQLLASEFERATESRTDRVRNVEDPSLDDASPPEAPVVLSDPPPPPPVRPEPLRVPEPPRVNVIASGTASTELVEPHNGNGNGKGRHAGHREADGNRHTNGEADGAEHLVGFAHFPDATAAPKVRWG